MRPNRLQVAKYWRSACSHPHSKIDPIFKNPPQRFFDVLSSLERSDLRLLQSHVRNFRKAMWVNELTAMLICLMIDERPSSGSYADRLLDFDTCIFYMEKCGFYAQRNGITDHKFLFHAYNCSEVGGKLWGDNLHTCHRSFINAMNAVEVVMSTMSHSEWWIFRTYQLHVYSEELLHAWGPFTIENMPKLIPELQNLEGTALDPNWDGEPPAKRILDYLGNHLLFPKHPWMTALSAYAFLYSSQSIVEEILLVQLVEAEIYLSEWARNPTSLPLEPTKAVDHIARALQQRADLAWYGHMLSATLRVDRATLVIPTPRIWDELFGDSSAEQLLAQLIESQSEWDTSEEFQIHVATYLKKWRGTPYFLELALVCIGLAANREHRPNSAMQIIRGVRHLLTLVSTTLGEAAGQPLNPKVIRRVLEETSRANPQAARRMKNLAIFYRSAWQSQQTFLVRNDDVPATLQQLLLPELRGRFNFYNGTDPVLDLRQQQRQADIDYVSDHWQHLHRCANANFVAIRAVMLAFRKATWALDPRRLNAPLSLAVQIPGGQSTWHLRVWTPRLFTEHIGGDGSAVEEQFFLEYCGPTSSGTEGLWCADLFRSWFDGEAAAQFETTWGRSVDWLRPSDRDVLQPSRSLRTYFRRACKTLRAEGRPIPCVFAPDPVYRAAIFGAIGFRLEAYGAHRAHELLQLRYEDEFLFERLVDVHHTRFMQFYPKGRKGTRSRPPRPSYTVVSDAADRAIEARHFLQEMTGEPYLADFQHGGISQGSGQFVLQVNGSVVMTPTLNVCLRFLSYSAFQGCPQVPNLTVHVLRHACAKQARKSGVSPDELALILNHAQLVTGAYYARPTRNDQLEILQRVAFKAGMWSSAMNSTVSKTAESRDGTERPWLFDLSEEEFEKWLEEVELAFEQEESSLIESVKRCQA